MGVHLSLIAVQVIGSLWIKKLSPEWSDSKPSIFAKAFGQKDHLKVVARTLWFRAVPSIQAKAGHCQARP